MNDPSILQILGRIEGKLDAEIELAREHREDDKRRFAEQYAWLGRHDEEINKAKGAIKVIIWLVGGGATALVATVVLILQVAGHG